MLEKLAEKETFRIPIIGVKVDKYLTISITKQGGFVNFRFDTDTSVFKSRIGYSRLTNPKSIMVAPEHVSRVLDLYELASFALVLINEVDPDRIPADLIADAKEILGNKLNEFRYLFAPMLSDAEYATLLSQVDSYTDCSEDDGNDVESIDGAENTDDDEVSNEEEPFSEPEPANDNVDTDTEKDSCAEYSDEISDNPISTYTKTGSSTNKNIFVQIPINLVTLVDLVQSFGKNRSHALDKAIRKGDRSGTHRLLSINLDENGECDEYMINGNVDKYVFYCGDRHIILDVYDSIDVVKVAAIHTAHKYKKTEFVTKLISAVCTAYVVNFCR